MENKDKKKWEGSSGIYTETTVECYSYMAFRLFLQQQIQIILSHFVWGLQESGSAWYTCITPDFSKQRFCSVQNNKSLN